MAWWLFLKFFSTNSDFCFFFFRVFDLLFMFLTVWYYCTLTIRESILKVNGSKIKGWWRLHHFISTVVGGVMLTWPDGTPYQGFRQQLMWFHVYISKYNFSLLGCQLVSIFFRKLFSKVIFGFVSCKIWVGYSNKLFKSTDVNYNLKFPISFCIWKVIYSRNVHPVTYTF